MAIEAFAGNTADADTMASQVVKLKQYFKLLKMAIVGDNGMPTVALIREDRKPAFDWITTLRATAV